MRSIFKVSAIAIFFVLTLAPEASAVCEARKHVTGFWKGDDGGTYVVRRVSNNVVWWIGKSGDGGKTWTNTFRGVINGDIISGEWADVTAAHGDANSGIGTLRLKIIGANGTVNGFEKVGGTGSGFGASKWRFECKD